VRVTTVARTVRTTAGVPPTRPLRNKAGAGWPNSVRLSERRSRDHCCNRPLDTRQVCRGLAPIASATFQLHGNHLILRTIPRRCPSRHHRPWLFPTAPTAQDHSHCR
jgi:hypothetical protein